MELIKMENISKSFGGLQALYSIDLSLGEGEILGLVGDNAAGKSTLMKILSGALIPDTGTIYFKGEQVKYRSPQDARKLGIEMIYQDLALIRCLDVASNMFLGKEPTTGIFRNFIKIKIDKKRMIKETKNALNELKIPVASVKTVAGNLSGGQQQSISIARALHFNAKLIIMDEPTSSLSIKETEKVLDLIKDFKKNKISAIVVSHRIQDIFQVADRVMILRHGAKVEDSRKDEISIDEVVKTIIGIQNNNG